MLSCYILSIKSNLGVSILVPVNITITLVQDITSDRATSEWSRKITKSLLILVVCVCRLTHTLACLGLRCYWNKCVCGWFNTENMSVTTFCRLREGSNSCDMCLWASTQTYNRRSHCVMSYNLGNQEHQMSTLIPHANQQNLVRYKPTN